MRRRLRKWKEYLVPRLLELIPTHARWNMTQEAYEKWASQPLDENYLKMIRETGSKFKEFVGTPGTLIDVGCGNGLYSGKPYEEIGYIPIELGDYKIYGLDPLPQRHPIPWISEYIQARCEDPILVKAEYASFATSFDHLEDPVKCILNLKAVGVKGIYIMEALSKSSTLGDHHHIRHYTKNNIIQILEETGYKIERFQVNQETDSWIFCFLEAKLK
jgi:hypothetical protein